MPRRRRLLLVTTNPNKVVEMERSLSKYDVEIVAIPPAHAASEAEIRELLLGSGESWYVSGVVQEQMNLYSADDGDSLSNFEKRFKPNSNTSSLTPLLNDGSENYDGRAVFAASTMIVYQLKKGEKTRILEARQHQQSMALHTRPTPLDKTTESKESEKDLPLNKSVYQCVAEGYLDYSRRNRTEKNDTDCYVGFGWDDIFVNISTSKTFAEMLKEGGAAWGKVSPRDMNISNYIIEHIHYKTRKSHAFLSTEDAQQHSETVSFAEEHSVGSFVMKQAYMNSPCAISTGLRDVFITVANQAFFRAAKTRREVNYWCPGLNAGIPFVAKKDPIHEITFTAHDFGHFLIPDLIYTGSTSRLARKVYILYRMMSEATTLVFADMLFVESLRKSGYEYDWSKRKIHPLFLATGLDPFGASNRGEFFAVFRQLLEANVAYCVLGDDSKYLDLIRKAGVVPLDRCEGKSCEALEAFKDKYMPFFVEDYKWTTANYQNMSAHAQDYADWWALVTPLASAAGVLGGDNQASTGIGLETVEQHMAAIDVDASDNISTRELIARIFSHVFQSRIQPIFLLKRVELAPEEVRRTQSFVRWLMGQAVLFSRFSFVAESGHYKAMVVDRITRILATGAQLSMQQVTSARSMYSQFVRLLGAKNIITEDDVVNYVQVCPIFDPVYVFYDEAKDFYQELEEVQRTILDGDEDITGAKSCEASSAKKQTVMMKSLSTIESQVPAVMSTTVVRVGVSCILVDPLTNKVVMGLRRGKKDHGHMTFHNPGGHAEVGESLAHTFARELQEETGIVVDAQDVRHFTITNDVFTQDKHYVTVHMLAEWDGKAQPVVTEPDKCYGWQWLHWSEVAELGRQNKLFLPLANLIKSPSFPPPVGWRQSTLRRHMHGKCCFFIGYPGSGKGTQGKVLAEQLCLRHVSTGELFRAEAKTGSEIGKKMDSFMKKGAIIPQEFTFDYLRKELSKAKYDDGFLLDGYPKDTECFQFIFEVLEATKREAAAAIFFDIDRAEVHRRLTGRLFCASCEKNYHVSIVEVMPKLAGVCDCCNGPLTARGDDTPATIDHRLDSYDAKTMPNVDLFQQRGLLLTIDATRSPSTINRDILQQLEGKVCPPRDSYYLCGDLSGEDSGVLATKRSTKWHNHMDAESDVLLHTLVKRVFAKYPDGQNKVYPISHLILGPQVNSKEFESVYYRLPNFHPIQEAVDEAFTTGAMGDSFDYDFTLATLEVCFEHPNRGVMTEVEEDLFEIEQLGDFSDVSASANVKITRDDGDSVTSIDWSRLPGWRERMISSVPAYELHHGIDLPKKEGETRPPIDLASLSALTNDTANRNSSETNDAVLHTGGWFIFAKADRWAYRSNEFSNQSYDECKAKLLKQFTAIRKHFDALLLSLSAEKGDEGEKGKRQYKNSASLEKVHAIWRI